MYNVNYENFTQTQRVISEGSENLHIQFLKNYSSFLLWYRLTNSNPTPRKKTSFSTTNIFNRIQFLQVGIFSFCHNIYDCHELKTCLHLYMYIIYSVVIFWFPRLIYTLSVNETKKNNQQNSKFNWFWDRNEFTRSDKIWRCKDLIRRCPECQNCVGVPRLWSTTGPIPRSWQPHLYWHPLAAT